MATKRKTYHPPKIPAKKEKNTAAHPHRPVWSGNITFGLINIPITIYSIENRTDLHFRMLDSRNLSKIRYERINEVTGEEVPWDEIVKGYEYDKNNYVVFKEEEIEKAAPEHTKNLEIEKFVAKEDIDPLYFDKPYYILPGEHAIKGYVLLREVLRKSQKVAIGKIVIRAREHLTVILPYGDSLLLNLLRFKQELKSLKEFEAPQGSFKDYKISNREVEVAEQLVNLMTETWDPDQYHDEFREILMEMIQKKIASKKKHQVTSLVSKKEETSDKSKNIVDFMSLLKKSLETKTNKKN